MKNIIISYSLTGNNEALANKIAEELAIKHIKIEEPKPRTTKSIIFDLIFNKTPKVQPTPDELQEYDLIIFFGPIWIGKVATPLRKYLKYLKDTPREYAFISISGGALGDNPKVVNELKKRIGKEPIAFMDFHIIDLLKGDSKITAKDISEYKINDNDIEKLIDPIIIKLKEII